MKRGMAPAVPATATAGGALALKAASETWGLEAGVGLEVRRANFCVPFVGAPSVGYAAARRPARSDCAAMAADCGGAAARSVPAPLAGRLRIPVPCPWESKESNVPYKYELTFAQDSCWNHLKWWNTPKKTPEAPSQAGTASPLRRRWMRRTLPVVKLVCVPWLSSSKCTSKSYLPRVYRSGASVLPSKGSWAALVFCDVPLCIDIFRNLRRNLSYLNLKEP